MHLTRASLSSCSFFSWLALHEHFISDYMRMCNTLSLSNFKFIDWVVSYCSEHRIVTIVSSSTLDFEEFCS